MDRQLEAELRAMHAAVGELQKRVESLEAENRQLRRPEEPPLAPQEAPLEVSTPMEPLEVVEEEAVPRMDEI